MGTLEGGGTTGILVLHSLYRQNNGFF